MFQFCDPTFEKRFRNNEVSPEQLKEHLMRNYSVFDLADALTDYLIEENEFVKNKIVLTNKQTQLIEILMRKIARPVYADKGRKPKTSKYLDAREDINPDLFVK